MNIFSEYKKARERRAKWETLWNECYEYTIPNYGEKMDKRSAQKDLYDSTAGDGVDVLASSLLSELTPPWSKWFELSCGSDIKENEKEILFGYTNEVEEKLQINFDQSNMAQELHQCYVDLSIIGTACLLFEEAQIGQSSAFQFKAIPMSEVLIAETNDGKTDSIFRQITLTIEGIAKKFGTEIFTKELFQKLKQNPAQKIKVIEAVIKKETGMGYEYTAFIENESNQYGAEINAPIILGKGEFETSPFIVFRFAKVPSELYGRSPVMKVLPDIKTANKVVELILKNASLAVTGVWQAEDDGVLNLANIKMVPGAIIPKAVGSSGLTPLKPAANFDVSNLVLDDMRAGIRKALMVDKLGPITMSGRMSATEVMERSAESMRVFGAIYGRLQSELLTPLINRAISILQRRGEIEKIGIDGRVLRLNYQSPLSRLKINQEIETVMGWMKAMQSCGTGMDNQLNKNKVAKWMARKFEIPTELIQAEDNVKMEKVKVLLENLNPVITDAVLNMSPEQIEKELMEIIKLKEKEREDDKDNR